MWSNLTPWQFTNLKITTKSNKDIQFPNLIGVYSSTGYTKLVPQITQTESMDLTDKVDSDSDGELIQALIKSDLDRQQSEPSLAIPVDLSSKIDVEMVEGK